MTRKKEGHVFFKVDVAPDLLERLDASAHDIGWSRAQLFREFVALWVDAWDKAQAEKVTKEEAQEPSQLSS